MRTARKFARIIKVVHKNPGIRQTDIAKHTGFPRVDVHRLCKAAVEEELLSAVKGRYYHGLFFENLMREGI